MDLTLHFPACPDRILVDFTIHVAPPPIPGTEHHTSPGQAARGGESAKRSRYGGRVLALSIETAGRMEPESRTNITALAGYARNMGVTWPAWRPGLRETALRRLLEGLRIDGRWRQIGRRRYWRIARRRILKPRVQRSRVGERVVPHQRKGLVLGMARLRSVAVLAIAVARIAIVR